MKKAATRRAEGKAQEIGGAVEKGVGRAVGNERMAERGEDRQARGKVKQETAKAQERVRGATEEIGGTAKRAVGELTGDRKLEREGRTTDVKGRIRRKLNE